MKAAAAAAAGGDDSDQHGAVGGMHDARGGLLDPGGSMRGGAGQRSLATSPITLYACDGWAAAGQILLIHIAHPTRVGLPPNAF